MSLSDYPPHIRLFASLLAQAQSIQDATALRPSALVITREQQEQIAATLIFDSQTPITEAFGFPVILGEKAGLFYEVTP